MWCEQVYLHLSVKLKSNCNLVFAHNLLEYGIILLVNKIYINNIAIFCHNLNKLHTNFNNCDIYYC